MPPPRRRSSVSDAYAVRHLALRDYLAVERTRLANERTVLAYLRTALALFAGSVTLLYLFGTTAARIAGWLLLPVAVAILAFGTARYIAVRLRVRDYARLYASRTDASDERPAPPYGGG